VKDLQRLAFDYMLRKSLHCPPLAGVGGGIFPTGEPHPHITAGRSRGISIWHEHLS